MDVGAQPLGLIVPALAITVGESRLVRAGRVPIFS